MKRTILKLYARTNPTRALARIKISKSIRQDAAREIGRNWMYEGNRTDFLQTATR
jgi:hypothetical protein